ncbi:hypothetical protein JI721_03080 [Alicyclobacillus cycloheptanicus]|uniref:Helix-turn-helix domain-containing protein n=1 Tax=Alicyclobacillus cycloheptanicus TaxID=1457 RepID=A0ABT9XK15_9BACL|nr:helix-turn-helix domain-containing protein [Alicyclobacillus cycloheptanicus]MDQ0190647.1 hypothetical protein [Alicyclobacillus cycloheptanicus]WDM01845.1 hypothetical protein JI721_03080 [Alicyclobacillus cycloheptanicus]
MANEDQTIFRHPHNRENPYAQIARATLQDTRLSWKSRGLLAYLLSLPTDWEISFAHLVKQAPDGKTSLQTAIKELQTYGYLEKKSIRDKRGRITKWENIIREVPLEALDHPDPDFRDQENLDVDTPDVDNKPQQKTYSNVHISRTKDRDNKQDTVVVNSDVLKEVIRAVEQELGVSVTSLVSRFPTWVAQYGEQRLIDCARYVKEKQMDFPIGAFRSAVEKKWDLQGGDNSGTSRNNGTHSRGKGKGLTPSTDIEPGIVN